MSSAASRPRLPLFRRAGSQASLVAAVWAVVLVCATLASFAAALSTAGYDHGLSAAVAAVDTSPDGADVTNVLFETSEEGDAPPLAASAAVSATTAALREVAGHYDADISIWIAGPMIQIGDDVPRRGYFLDADTVSDNANLIDGRWPQPTSTGATEVAIPLNVAEALKVGLGDSLTLGQPRALDGSPLPTTPVTVVGFFTPTGSPQWLRDPLRGAGIHVEGTRVPEYGPFLVPVGTLASSDAPFERLTARMDPHLGSDASGIPHMTRGIGSMGHQLTEQFGDSVRWVIVRSDLPSAFATMITHMQLATSLAVAVLVVVLAVALAAVALIAELVARRRTTETTLLRDRGASSRQLGVRAGTEAIVVSGSAALVAVPLAWLSYQAVASTAWFGAAWQLGARAEGIPTAAWWAAGAAALAAAAVLIIVAVRPTGRSGFSRRSRASSLANSGADVALAVIAVVGVIQLRTHVPTAGHVDPVLVAAPALCVLAAAALVSRLLPAAARAAERVPRRSLGVAWPLAGWHVARGGAMRGTFLAVASAATISVGVVFLSTWSQSQVDQADAGVGADVTVAQAVVPGGGEALAASAGGDLHPVTDRAIVLGTRPDGVALFAIDSAIAPATVTGRPVGFDSWGEAIQELGGAPAPTKLTVDGPTVTLDVKGTVGGDQGGFPAVVSAVPHVVVQNDLGDTAILVAPRAVLDGASHTVIATAALGSEPLEGTLHVIAIQMHVDQSDSDAIYELPYQRADAEFTVTVADSSGDGDTWSASGDTGAPQITPTGVTSNGAAVHVKFSYAIYGIYRVGGDITLMPFELSESVPVLVSAELARDAGLAQGDKVDLSTNYSKITGVVAGTVPYVPGHVNRSSLWADKTALTRALLSVGDISTPTDGWWGSGMPDAAAASLRADGFGPVQSRAERAVELSEDPGQVPLRLAWLLAIVAATALAIAGAAAHAAAEAQHRGLTIAKLRAIGVSRRDSLRSHLAQHSLAVGGAVLAGFAIGLVLAALLAPALVVSPAGGRPVPSAVLVVPWIPLLVIAGSMLALALAAGIPASRAAVRRSTIAALRTGEIA